MSDLEEFTSQLNSETDQPAAPQQPAQPQMTPQQMAMMQKAKEMQAKLLAMPLTHDDLKGKVDLKYYGHSGVKVHFVD